jgi:hypothetical protein
VVGGEPGVGRFVRVQRAELVCLRLDALDFGEMGA